jgi:hypothetical protein
MPKKLLTATKRKVRTRKTKQVVETFDGYTNKKLMELIENPVTDTGLEVNREAAYDELMRRYDAMSDDMIREYTLEDRIDMVGSPVGFDLTDEERFDTMPPIPAYVPALPILVVLPPSKPENWESIPPPVPAWLIAKFAKKVTHAHFFR